MNKQEFLEKLRLALNGRVAPSVVTENINYYEDYINVEVRKGRSEEEVLAQLGDPRLLARTIVATHGGNQTAAGGKGADYDYDGGRSEGFREYASGEGKRFRERGNGVFRIPGWVLLILFLVVVVIVLSLVFSLVSVLLPVLLPILLVVFLVKLFRDWMN